MTIRTFVPACVWTRAEMVTGVEAVSPDPSSESAENGFVAKSPGSARTVDS